MEYLSRARPVPLTALSDLGRGNHLAVMYHDLQERDAWLMPFLSEGLEAGGSALCVGKSPASLTDAHDVGCEHLNLLQTVPPSESYFHGGRFSADSMRSWLSDQVSEADGRQNFSRIAGDLNWTGSLDESGFDDLFGYEEWLDQLAVGRPSIFACFYDVRELPADHVLDVFKNHRIVGFEGVLIESPFYRN